jgi:methylmalonyl-CoA carboxyltransferase 12S subunit
MVEKKSTPRKNAADVTADLVARIAELEVRMVRLEAARDAAAAGLVAPTPAVPARPAATTAAPTAAHEEVTEEVLMVIAATVAAFLGERAHVRQVRLVASEAWAQQGRVSVMASHRWAMHRG